jgi:hypothetical protein
MTRVEVDFDNATKLVIFQDCLMLSSLNCVVFERYCGGRMTFRSTCALDLGDSRLSNLELLSLRWAIHHSYLLERGKWASEFYQLEANVIFEALDEPQP